MNPGHLKPAAPGDYTRAMPRGWPLRSWWDGKQWLNREGGTVSAWQSLPWRHETAPAPSLTAQG